MKAAVGGDFIITPRSALPLTGFWSSSGPVFPPLPASADWSYAPRGYRPSSSPAARRARAERHNPRSIATLRIKIGRVLLQQLPTLYPEFRVAWSSGE